LAWFLHQARRQSSTASISPAPAVLARFSHVGYAAVISRH